jgi:hypothetical protein
LSRCGGELVSLRMPVLDSSRAWVALRERQVLTRDEFLLVNAQLDDAISRHVPWILDAVETSIVLAPDFTIAVEVLRGYAVELVSPSLRAISKRSSLLSGTVELLRRFRESMMPNVASPIVPALQSAVEFVCVVAVDPTLDSVEHELHRISSQRACSAFVALVFASVELSFFQSSAARLALHASIANLAMCEPSAWEIYLAPVELLESSVARLGESERLLASVRRVADMSRLGGETAPSVYPYLRGTSSKAP